MNSFIQALFFCVLTPIISTAQNYGLVLGQNYSFIPQKILPLNSGFLVGASSNDRQNRLIKINDCGQVEWVKNITPFNTSNPLFIIDYCLDAHHNIFMGGQLDVLNGYWPVLIKADSVGNIVWAKVFHTGDSRVFDRIKAFPDGTIVCASTDFATVFDQNGGVKWSKVFSHDSFAQSFDQDVEILDNKEVCFGATGNLNNLSPGILLYKVDTLGKVAFSKIVGKFGKIYSNNYDFEKLSITCGPQNSITVLSNFSKHINAYNVFESVIKFSNSGRVEWNKVYDAMNKWGGGAIIPIGSYVNSSHELLITANSSSNISKYSTDDGVVLELDTSGGVRWSKVYPDWIHSYPMTGLPIAVLNNGNIAYSYLKPVSGTFSDVGYLNVEKDPTKYRCSSIPFIMKGPVSEPLMDTPVVIQDSSLSPQSLNIQITSTQGSVKKRYYCYDIVPIVELGPEDTTLCVGEKLYYDLRSSNPGCRFMNSFGDTSGKMVVSKSGTYWMRSSKGFCTFTDTINVNFVYHHGPLHKKAYKICPSDSLKLDAGNSADNYHWFLPGKEVTTGRVAILKDTGTYVLRMEAGTGCFSLDTFQVSFYPLPKANAGPDSVICFGQTIEMNGSGGVKYKWIPATFIDNDTLPNPKADPVRDMTYYLVTTNAFGCSDTDTVMLKVRPPLKALFSGHKFQVCSGDSLKIIPLEVSGGNTAGYSFKWYSKQATFSDKRNLNYPVSSNGHIYFDFSDGCSIPFRDSFLVTVNKIPDAEISITDSTGCEPLPVIFRAGKVDPFIKVQWNTGNGRFLSGSETIYYYSHGVYSPNVVLTDTITGCTTLKKLPKIVVLKTPENHIVHQPVWNDISDPKVTFFAKGDSGAFAWNISDGTKAVGHEFAHQFADTGQYTVTLLTVNSFGCSDTATELIVIHDIFRMAIPNSFSPNGDGNNDVFYPKGTFIDNCDLKIYNCWGQLIHAESGQSVGWTGILPNNTTAPEGVYLYTLTVTDLLGKQHYLSGTVTLLR